MRPEEGQRRRPARRRHWLLWTFAVVIVLLIVGRLMLPSFLQDYVNRRLDQHPGYSGSIGPIHVQLWRGAYSIRDVMIYKTGMDMEAPLFQSARLDLAIEWDELFHGALVGEITMVRPQVNFIAGPTPEQTQTGEDQQWDETLKDLFPFRLNRVEIRDGEVRFLDPHSTPKVDVSIHNLTAVATNLTNARDTRQTLPAGVTARGLTVGDGLVDLQVHLNPMERHPTFEMTCVLTNVNVVALNDLLQAYGKFDVEKGTMHLYTSVASTDGQYEGYVKVLFEDLDVVQWEKDQKESALGVFWEAVVGTFTTLFKNQPKDRLATKVPIAGSYQDTDVGTWTAVSTLLRNAFIRALLPKLDQQMSLGDVGDRQGEADAGADAADEKDKPQSQDRESGDDRNAQDRRDRPRPFQEKGAERLLRVLEEKASSGETESEAGKAVEP
jgi:hypothetical protein